MENSKIDDKVVIKDAIWNKDFYNGLKTRKRLEKVFRIDYFIPKNMVKLKNEDGSLGVRIVNITDLEKIV